MSDTGRLNQRAFTARAAQAVRDVLPAGWVVTEDGILRVVAEPTTGDDPPRMTITLTNFYAATQRPGARLAGVVDAIQQMVRSQLAMLAESTDRVLPWDAAAPLLRVQLNPAGVAGVTVPWRDTDLVLRLVLDYPTAIRVVTPDMLAAWGESLERTIAHATLQTHAMLAGAHPIAHPLAIWHWKEPVGYAGTRLICPDLLRRDVGVPDDLIVVAPGRDLLIAAPLDTPAEQLACLAAVGMRGHGHWLAPHRVFVLRGDTIRRITE